MLRQVFNDGQYEERVLNGDLSRRITRSYPTPSRDRHPLGTTSRFYDYLDQDGTVVAKAFHHDRPTDPWKPDPKWLRLGQEILVAAHGEHETCPDCTNFHPKQPDQ